MGEIRNAYILDRNLRGRDHSEELSKGGRIILKRILGSRFGEMD